jgi:hypothetical protein
MGSQGADHPAPLPRRGRLEVDAVSVGCGGSRPRLEPPPSAVSMLCRQSADPEERSGLCSTALVLAAVSGVAGVAGVLLLPERVQASVGTGWLVGLWVPARWARPCYL